MTGDARPSTRMRLITAFLRHVNKPRVARAKNLAAMRGWLERAVPMLAAMPTGATPREVEGALWVGPSERGVAILYLHGGGFVMGAPETHRHLAAALALAADAPALVLRYRRAPEHPHPAQIDDALAAYRGLVARGLRVAAAGDSAGGGLACALTLAARREGLPDPACVAAFSPWCDMTLTSPTLRANMRSDAMLPAERFAEVVAMRMAGGDPRDPLASPVFARFDAPPPPLFITASRAELLAGDAAAMAEVWRAAGGRVTMRWSADAPHAWPVFVGAAPEADATVAEAGAFIASRLSGENRP
ncbi:alpha/beta hydrolase fold domain-containing protein [Rubrimonas cliftonensis]|uniref:Acetyl esterase/lipase n=1 Tax=Rubrimonas cliftonensis TaxID=89524 RepID=A0A1H3WQP5_9RHOB|nr:alpha/beta hydrolase fold domain-containing protein [Rubrimonas cliftonensis]SDZ89453.1 Acetyl esterase/lipase [Rubrimonas cliftonensis]